MREERYTITRMASCKDGFYLRVHSDDGDTGEVKPFFSNNLEKAIRDLQEINEQCSTLSK